MALRVGLIPQNVTWVTLELPIIHVKCKCMYILWNKLTPLPPLRTIKSLKKYMKRLLLTSNY